jgi:hypothetical protein
VTKEEIIAAIRECAEKVGRTPKFMEFLTMFPKIRRKAIRREFTTYMKALEASGLEGSGVGYSYPMKTLFRNWAGVVRELQRVPSMSEYELYSRFSYQPITRRFKSWLNVPRAMAQYAINEGLQEEYADVLEIVRVKQVGMMAARAASQTAQAVQAAPVNGAGPRPVRPMIASAGQVYGMPLITSPLAFGPMNEAGVLFLFGMLAERLGFIVTHVQTAFPDLQALVRVDENSCQMVKIEAEYESRNFREHMHSAKDCDLIVCWIHNWPDCPLEVIELRSVAMEMAGVKQSP